MAIDGADQVLTGDLCCIKGGGGAHLREKVVARSANEFVVMVDSSKVRDVLSFPVPLEVLPFAWGYVKSRVEAMGAEVNLRYGSGKIGPVISDNGNLIADAKFGDIDQPRELSDRLDNIPGLLEHGIFDRVDRVIVGRGSDHEHLTPLK
jgi:ribose 5-phosphate isomerase A